MESDRVEMSVGNGTVNGDHLVNGVAANGASINAKVQPDGASKVRPENGSASSYTNGENNSTRRELDGGAQDRGNILKDAPPELLQVLSSEFYLPMATLISRSAQTCWNDLSALVDRLAAMPAPTSNAPNTDLKVDDQSRANLEKKDLLLNFAKEHKDVFIKLLVLLQWSRRSDEVRKTIELNLWLQQRRQAFNNATGMLGAMLRGLADSQVPNPDLYTASEVLATGRVSTMPKLGYIPQPALTPTRVLRILRRLDTILCTRMALTEDFPYPLRNFHIHDGRVTFTIPDEFSFDVSVASEDLEAKYGMVDFAFHFSPSPPIPDNLHDEITYITNTALDKNGFIGVYDFLHDLTLSYKLNEFAKQAQQLSRGLWNGHLRVEVLRRTLVVQYWLKSSISKSWIEVGIHSGKKQDDHNMPGQVPRITLRWLREGKLTESTEVYIDLSRLSFEHVLRQVIAQHTNYLFDAIYDKLIPSPLYNNAGLVLDQTISSEDPAQCNLEVQLSRTDNLHVSMEAISGSLILSPVSERTNRLQHDLVRSKNVVDDFVSRLPGLRSSTAESNLIKSLPNSQWQRLEGVKISLSEAEKLFGQAVTKISCLRLPNWAPEWMMIVTQTTAGDLWWLTQSIRPNSIVGSHTTKVVDHHPLYMVGSPSPAFLEKLAEYTTGVMALQCNAEFLNKNKLRWRLPDIPTLDDNTQLPALQFARTSVTPTSNPTSGTVQQSLEHPDLRQEASSTIHMTYHGVDRQSQKVVMIAKFVMATDPAVLRELVSSKLDRSVAIIPEKQQVMVKIESDPGMPIIASLVSKISHLENIAACAAAVRKSTEHTLQSLSLSSITILYHRRPDLSLRIDFGQNADEFSATFLPSETNPQCHLSPWVVKSMKRKGSKSNQSLSNIFIVLRMTRPILSYLQNIQKPISLQSDGSPEIKHHLRIHVLHRQPTSYGLQYFADSAHFDRDEVGPETPTRLLARFEILAMKHRDRLMWVVRPAIEEFNSYNRPSYTSKTLREVLDRDVFKKKSSLWLDLDGGAACPSDKPEQLLSAIHNTVVTWAKRAVTPNATREQAAPTTNETNTNGSVDKKSNRSNMPPQKPQNQQQQQQRPNGVQRPQPNNQQKPQNFGNRNQGPKQLEVITLD